MTQSQPNVLIFCGSHGTPSSVTSKGHTCREMKEHLPMTTVRCKSRTQWITSVKGFDAVSRRLEVDVLVLTCLACFRRSSSRVLV